jgi:hypothetical protein
VFREIMRNPEESEKDIPEAEIIGKKIKLGQHTYDLIMCYLCPLCDKPILAYWQLPPHDNRATENVVERALRDSGFGGFRFFSTVNGQGFEYDPVKDPRKRHNHPKSSAPDWRGMTKYTELWEPFIKLNPVFSVNDFLARIIDPHNTTFPRDFQFVSKTGVALSFIRAMENRSGIFQVSKDIMKHGKPIFWFNVVKWDEKIEYRSAADAKMRLDMIAEWIGDDRISEVNIESPLANIVDINKRRY